MYAVINKLTLGKPIDGALVASVERDLAKRMRAQPGFVEMRLVRVSDREATILVFFETREALDAISKNVAAPWFAEHVKPYLAGPVDRVVGEVVARC